MLPGLRLFVSRRWSYTEQSSWDLVAVYYGNRTDWDCPKVQAGEGRA